MKRIVCLSTVLVMLFSCTKEETRMVNQNGSKEASKLLDFLYQIQGKYILSGQHNFIATGSKYTNLIEEITGKSPIVWGSDFSFCYQGDAPDRYQHCGPLNLTSPPDSAVITGLTPERARQQLVQNAIQKHREGYIITLMWHACPPGLGDCCDGDQIWTMENRPSQQEWDELTTDGTSLNEAWKEQVDNIAGYLKQLRDASVPVLWRPYHEMNGVWFWWCNKKGENGFKKLWLMMYDRYVNHHKLNNLIWVWNTNAPRDIPNDEAFAYEDFWPGPQYVDVLAADVYRKDWKQSHHDDLLKLANGKPIAIGELAGLPTPDILRQQDKWTWFMPWGNLVTWANTDEAIREMYGYEKLLTREQVMMDGQGNYHVKLDHQQ